MSTITVTSKHVEANRPKPPKSNSRAYKVILEMGTIKEEKFYERVETAHWAASFATSKFLLCKAHVLENVGKETYVDIATYESGNTADPSHQGKPKKRAISKGDAAKGLNQDQRWKDAMARDQVVICIRRKGAKLSEQPRNMEKIEQVLKIVA